MFPPLDSSHYTKVWEWQGIYVEWTFTHLFIGFIQHTSCVVNLCCKHFLLLCHPGKLVFVYSTLLLVPFQFEVDFLNVSVSLADELNFMISATSIGNQLTWCHTYSYNELINVVAVAMSIFVRGSITCRQSVSHDVSHWRICWTTPLQPQDYWFYTMDSVRL